MTKPTGLPVFVIYGTHDFTPSRTTFRFRFHCAGRPVLVTESGVFVGDAKKPRCHAAGVSFSFGKDQLIVHREAAANVHP